MKTRIDKLIVLAAILLLFSCQSNTEKKSDSTSSESKDVPAEVEKPTATPAELAAYAYGIDVSRGQRNEIDSLNINTDSLSFIICKATEGVTYTDPYFESNWEKIPKKGFIRGAYHFYHTDDKPEVQAAFFVKTLTGLKDTDIAPVLDFEEASIEKGKTIDQIQADLMVFLKEVEKLSGRKPIIYTDDNIGNSHLNNPEFADYALWIAYPAEVKEPRLPTTWQSKGWAFWQKSWKYKIDGFTDDFDRYNGNLAELKRFIKDY